MMMNRVVMIPCLLIVLVAIMSSRQSIVPANQEKEATNKVCVDQIVDYLAQHSIPEPVEGLVGKSREFYPDFAVLFGDDVIKFGYEPTLVDFVEKKPIWNECVQVSTVIDVMGARVPCYRELKISIKDVVRSTENQAARDVIEADYVCQMAYM